MKIERKEIVKVIESEYTITLNEEAAMILVAIMGNIAGCNSWRTDFIDPMYRELGNKIGFNNYYEWYAKNKDHMCCAMQLKNEEQLS